VLSVHRYFVNYIYYYESLGVRSCWVVLMLLPLIVDIMYIIQLGKNLFDFDLSRPVCAMYALLTSVVSTLEFGFEYNRTTNTPGNVNYSS